MARCYQFTDRRLHPVKSLCLLAVLSLLICVTVAHADRNWYPVEVDVWQTPFDAESERKQMTYAPLERAQRKWRVNVYIPHLKDAYWLGVNYGLIDEARRLGVSLSIHEAGGYEHLDIQHGQIKDGLSEDPDGVIIGAISVDGLNDIVKDAHEKGIPVIDSINGMSSPLIAARVAADFSDLGFAAGNYVLGMQKGIEEPLSVAWFPGPEGAGWVAAGDEGFRKALAGSGVRIVTTRYGDTGSAAQGELVETALDRHADDLDFVVGTAVTAEVASKILRRRGLAGRIRVIAYYYSPGVHRGIRRGTVLAAPTDLTVIQARIALDVMVRILEQKDFFRHVAPRVIVIDKERVRSWDSSTTLAPRGFRPIFSINK